VWSWARAATGDHPPAVRAGSISVIVDGGITNSTYPRDLYRKSPVHRHLFTNTPVAPIVVVKHQSLSEFGSPTSAGATEQSNPRARCGIRTHRAGHGTMAAHRTQID